MTNWRVKLIDEPRFVYECQTEAQMHLICMQLAHRGHSHMVERYSRPLRLVKAGTGTAVPSERSGQQPS